MYKISSINKILIVLLTVQLIFPSISLAKNINFNAGYTKSLGMVGIYGFMYDYSSKKYTDSKITSISTLGGGGFIYFNPVNTIYGNLSLGISSNYSQAIYNNTVGNISYNSKTHLTPITFNIAYMTSSNIVNAWGGIGFSALLLNTEITGGSIKVDKTNTTNINKQSNFNSVGFATDFFVGAEYLFTANRKWGVFLEVRYSLSPDIKFDTTINGNTLSDKFKLSKINYHLGISFHY